MDQKLLRAEIEKSLRADSWTMTDDSGQLVAEKADGGGHKSAAIFSFADAGKGSSYEMLGKSGHNVNWLTFGILGAAMKHKTSTPAPTSSRTSSTTTPHEVSGGQRRPAGRTAASGRDGAGRRSKRPRWCAQASASSR
jgi:hypothetical protein